jgi:hypothetical protein
VQWTEVVCPSHSRLVLCLLRPFNCSLLGEVLIVDSQIVCGSCDSPRKRVTSTWQRQRRTTKEQMTQKRARNTARTRATPTSTKHGKDTTKEDSKQPILKPYKNTACCGPAGASLRSAEALGRAGALRRIKPKPVRAVWRPT